MKEFFERMHLQIGLGLVIVGLVLCFYLSALFVNPTTATVLAAVGAVIAVAGIALMAWDEIKGAINKRK